MLRKHVISFRVALNGFLHATRTQPNFRIHLTLSTLAIILGIVLKLSTIEWVLLVFTIALGLAIELINTAIESTVDLITDQWHMSAKIAKDTSAAAMLLYAVSAVIIAAFLFLPKLINL